MIRYIALFVTVFNLLEIGQCLPTVSNKSLDKIWQIPQKDGSFRWMTLDEAVKEASAYESQESSTKKFNKVRFFLYTPDNSTKAIEIDKDDPETLARSTFNYKNPTRFYIHGWNGGYNLSDARLIREALLLQGSDRQFNFIAVDWSVYGESITYITSQTSVSKAGKIVAEFIDWMHDSAKLSFDTLALYGHSLGAHVVGFTGKNVKHGRVHTIIGLDPAMPLFNYNKPNSRLAETDGDYVETIHTNGGMLGFYQPIGRASFYPNGGKNQPGCGLDMSCSHGRSVEYLAEALALSKDNGFNALKCKDFEDVQNASCTISKEDVRLGQPSNAQYAKGYYYLKTNSQSPYGVKS
ncbi:phospholipase A1-like [Episyrphus balteatus]|uniref:phospholipase A1-like n=1 Tax=Episyrphus balteatus TaxID=286459 RepID=UPI002484E41D|nr:phospholipase A1-like [Episyrphus balteatus]